MPEEAKPKSKFAVVINASVEDVWREITRTDAPIKAFFNNRMHVSGFHPGSPLAMRTPNDKFTGVVGEILEFNPPHRFSHTFMFTDLNDPPCAVVYDLKPVAGGTEFTLSILDAAPGTKTAKRMMSGAKMINSTLKNVLERGKPSVGIRLLYRMFALMSIITPKRCRSEHWGLEEIPGRIRAAGPQPAGV